MERFRLLHPECLRLVETDPGFAFVRHDVLATITQQFQVVRAMNLFHRNYFSEDELHLAIANVLHSLHEGGLFVTGSDQDGSTAVDGGMNRCQNGRFHREYRSGDGSSIDSVILNATRTLSDASVGAARAIGGLRKFRRRSASRTRRSA